MLVRKTRKEYNSPTTNNNTRNDNEKNQDNQSKRKQQIFGMIRRRYLTNRDEFKKQKGILQKNKKTPGYKTKSKK